MILSAMMLKMPLQFRFSADGLFDEGPKDLSLTYVGKITRKAAEADAQKRFENWQRLPLIARIRRAEQIIVR